MKLFLLFISSFVSIANCFAQVTETDGEWSKQFVTLSNTPEAEYMVRYGDIDNFGFGFISKDPFKGEHTPAHPKLRASKDSLYFDMLLITSSSQGNGCEELSTLNTTNYKFGFDVLFQTKINTNLEVNKIVLQLFLDDVQSLNRDVQFKVYVNNTRAPFIEERINNMDQSSNIGNLLSIPVPSSFIPEFTKPELHLQIDDSTSNLCESFAVDFIKIQYNPVYKPIGHIKFIVRDRTTNEPLYGATVKIQNIDQVFKTNSEGEVIVDSLPIGYISFQTSCAYYPSSKQCMDVVENRLEYVYVNLDRVKTDDTYKKLMEARNKKVSQTDTSSSNTASNEVNENTRKERKTRNYTAIRVIGNFAIHVVCSTVWQIILEGVFNSSSGSIGNVSRRH
jgi:hypothetical protein